MGTAEPMKAVDPAPTMFAVKTCSENRQWCEKCPLVRDDRCMHWYDGDQLVPFILALKNKPDCGGGL